MQYDAKNINLKFADAEKTCICINFKNDTFREGSPDQLR